MTVAKRAAKSTSSRTTPAKAGAKSTPRRKANDAIQVLTKDHRDVKKLFNAYQKLADADAPADERQGLSAQICAALTAHATVEEEIFYPAVREAAKNADDPLDEAEVEHASVKAMVSQIQGMDPDDELYDATVKVLGEYVNHHVKEEEGVIFPKAMKAHLDMTELGEQVLARKEELMGLLH